jgi:2-hydroxychromene-2-carboxylate isomerase
MNAIFVDRCVITRTVLGKIAAEIGLSGTDFVSALDSAEINNRHESVLDRAINDGAFGAPSFVVNGELYWGNDRLVLVEHALMNDQ